MRSVSMDFESRPGLEAVDQPLGDTAVLLVSLCDAEMCMAGAGVPEAAYYKVWGRPAYPHQAIEALLSIKRYDVGYAAEVPEVCQVNFGVQSTPRGVMLSSPDGTRLYATFSGFMDFITPLVDYGRSYLARTN